MDYNEKAHQKSQKEKELIKIYQTYLYKGVEMNLLLLMSIKIRFKNTIIMLRGNHECRQMTTNFNFKKECEVKYDAEIYNLFMETFDCLPLSCSINEKFISLHGGLSPDLKKIEDISIISRFQEPPKNGLMCDILWSDPIEKDEDAKNVLYMPNSARNCSYIFGAKATKPFLEKNPIHFLIDFLK